MTPAASVLPVREHSCGEVGVSLSRRAIDHVLGTSPVAEMDDHIMYYAKRDPWPALVRAVRTSEHGSRL
jgi:hypothetical protein